MSSGIRTRINPGYSTRTADAELSDDMKPSEIADALTMLRFATGDTRRTVGMDRETMDLAPAFRP